MHEMMLLQCLTLLASIQRQESGWQQTLAGMLGRGLEVGSLLLTFTVAIFIVLVFAVRVLMIIRKLPVPVDPVDMAKPKGFRAVMLGSAALLTPLAALDFLPIEGLDPRWVLVVAYVFEVLLAVALWFALHVFYKARAKRS